MLESSHFTSHFTLNSGTYTHDECACSNTPACALVGLTRYTITTSIFSFFDYDVYNRCFYVNVITVNTKVDSELYKQYTSI